jgi:hypothetical protein
VVVNKAIRLRRWSAVGDLTFVMNVGQPGAGHPDYCCLIRKDPTTLVAALNFLVRRSSGLGEHTLGQWARRKAVNATSSLYWSISGRSAESGGRVQLTSTPGFCSVRSPEFSHGRAEHAGQRRGCRNDGLPGPRWACCLHKGVRYRGIPPAGLAPGTLVGIRPIGSDR